MATNNFLAGFQNVLLRHVIMPGSHDAGLAGPSYDSLGMFGSGRSNTVTQSVGVGQQAEFGSRFFDVRILKSGGVLKAYHSPKDTRAVGGVGQGFGEILNQLRDFVAAHSTEFVIVRLAHLKDSDEVFDELLSWIAVPTNGARVYKGTGNLANKFVHELAGTIVLLIEGKKLVLKKFKGRRTVPGQIDGFHKLYQNKKNKPLPDVRDGLCLCGEFASKSDLAKIVVSQTENYSSHDRHRTHADDKVHLYCLYWTSTGGNIEANTRAITHSNFQRVRSMVLKHTKETAQYCQENNIPLVNTQAWSNAIRVEDRARQKYAVFACSLPNIILYDFVNTDTSAEIIGLNGLVLCAS
jgi:hypothetical protein